MCKKATFGVLGLLLVGGLLFGGKVIPYVQTAFQKVKASAQDSVPVSFQLDAAKAQLKKIDPEIKQMVWQIAKEKAQVKKLAANLEKQTSDIASERQKMLTLRNHVSSGEKFYVGTNGKAYTNERVESELRQRFNRFQIAEKTLDKSTQILALRESSLDSALEQLDEAKSQQRELEIQIENLTARHRMNEVATTASQINIDNSQLSKTRQMLEDIDARLSAEEEMMDLIPQYTGQIPVGDDDYSGDTNILDEMDAYFDRSDSTDDVEDDELVYNRN
jgi:multidrug resistance efflux pump